MYNGVRGIMGSGNGIVVPYNDKITCEKGQKGRL
jgi:hypothetical protein